MFFLFSKVMWFVVSPDSLIVIIFSVGIIMIWRNHYLWARYIFTVLFVIVITIAAIPVGDFLLIPLETKFPSNPEINKLDGMLVLGGAEKAKESMFWDQVVVGEAVERNLTFMKYARKYPDAKLIFSGGSSSISGSNYTDASVARRMFKEQDIDISKIIFEETSRNTYESIVNSKKLVQPNENENWIVITTAWHMPRTMNIFCKVGWTVTPYPVDYLSIPGETLYFNWGFASNLKTLKLAIKEWLGIFSYSLLNKSC